MFGPWSIEPADEFEVLTYRVGLTATMAGMVAVPFTTYWQLYMRQQQQQQ